MATAEHEVTYKDGRKRTKLLTPEGAQEIRELDSVSNVKKVEKAHDKSRSASGNKEASTGATSQTAGKGDQPA